jgi:hypothetical protein
MTDRYEGPCVLLGGHYRAPTVCAVVGPCGELPQIKVSPPSRGRETGGRTDAVNPCTPVEQHGAYNKDGFGVKADQGKLQWCLLPLKYLRGVVRVLMKGAAKYSPHNWRAGMPWSQTYNAALRHLDAFWSGEDVDPETGESHLDHALCCLLFLRAHNIDYPELDDRYKTTTVGNPNDSSHKTDR